MAGPTVLSACIVRPARGVIAQPAGPVIEAVTVPGPQGARGDSDVNPLVYPITAASSFTASHGKSYMPDAWLLDPSGALVDTDVLYAAGSVTLVFPQPFTGTLFIR